MTDRRTTLLDGAIAVLGEQGVRAVTHRAVDASAGLPAGSTSNHFRTRDALFDAIVVRVAQRERDSWEQLARREWPTSPAELAVILAASAVEATSTHRTLVLARYAILVEAGCRPELRHQLRRTGAEVSGWFLAWLRTAGSTDPGQDGHLIMNYWTGLVLHELAMPDPEFDPAPHLRRLLAELLPDPIRAGVARSSEGVRDGA